MSKWAIAKRDTTVFRTTGSNKAGKYGDVLEAKPFRKFASRGEARTFRGGLKDPSRYYIVNLTDNTICR